MPARVRFPHHMTPRSGPLLRWVCALGQHARVRNYADPEVLPKGVLSEALAAESTKGTRPGLLSIAKDAAEVRPQVVSLNVHGAG